jgi:hypothetical protein
MQKRTGYGERMVSIEEFKKLSTAPKRSKYGARKSTFGGRVFDSRAEALRFRDLDAMERTGRIRGLVLQPEVAIQTGIYRADFRYEDAQGATHWEDVKGHATPVCRMKLKMVAQLGIAIELITERSHPQYFKRSKGFRL